VSSRTKDSQGETRTEKKVLGGPRCDKLHRPALFFAPKIKKKLAGNSREQRRGKKNSKLLM